MRDLNLEMEVHMSAQPTLLPYIKLQVFYITFLDQNSHQEMSTHLTSSTPTSLDQLPALKLIQLFLIAKLMENTDLFIQDIQLLIHMNIWLKTAQVLLQITIDQLDVDSISLYSIQV